MVEIDSGYHSDNPEHLMVQLKHNEQEWLNWKYTESQQIYKVTNYHYDLNRRVFEHGGD